MIEDIKNVEVSFKGRGKRATLTRNAQPPTNQEVASKIVNSAIENPYGMGGACDMSSNPRAVYNQPFTFLEQMRQSEILYFSDWQSQKIIDIPVDDMLREDWLYKGLGEDEVGQLIHYQDGLKVQRIFREALRLERLHGGSAIFLGIADEVDDPSMPIDFSRLGENSLRYLNAVPRHRINRVVMQTDPTLPDYGSPSHYDINGREVHKSRLLLFDGDPLLPVRTLTFASNINMRNDGFGVPILMRLFNSLVQATGSRQAAFHLIQRASTLVFSGDVQTMSSTVQGNNNLSILQNTLNQINNYNATMLQSMPGSSPASSASLETLAANFGSVPELVMTYLQVLSAASDIPATRFLGQAPGGLNATGVSDLENYYNMIGARQNHRLKPNLISLLRLMLPSAGINTPLTEVKIEFEPLWNMTDVEEAQVRQIDTQNISTFVAQGLISDEEAVEESRLRGLLLTDPEDFPPPTPVDADDSLDPTQALDQLRKVKVGTPDDANTTTQGEDRTKEAEEASTS